MQINWLVKENNPQLLIVALGWGASVEVIGNQSLPENTDVVALCDYSDLSYAKSELPLENYKTKYLIAWSFGVWASEQLFSGEEFVSAVAICGTPRPISRDYGIDPRIFAVTLRGVLNDGVVQFVTRMCGKHLRDYLKNHSTRSLTDIQQELQVLNIEGAKDYTPSLRWTKAAVADLDLIFAPKPTLRYWNEAGVKVEILNQTPHYPFYNSDLILWAINN